MKHPRFNRPMYDFEIVNERERKLVALKGCFYMVSLASMLAIVWTAIVFALLYYVR